MENQEQKEPTFVAYKTEDVNKVMSKLMELKEVSIKDIIMVIGLLNSGQGVELTPALEPEATV